MEKIQYRVESIKELQKVVDHFDKYPLVSGKAVDYFLFKECFNIIKQQEHLTNEGLLKLVGIKASLNLGLPLNLKEAFPNVEGGIVDRIILLKVLLILIELQGFLVEMVASV